MLVSQDDVRRACQLWLDAINARVPVTSDEVIWSTIRQKLGRLDLAWHELRDSVEEYAGHPAIRGRWYSWYQAASKSKAPHRLTADTWDGLERALDSQRVGFVVYFRSLDRSPGGNTSTRVLKFVLDHERTLTFQHIHCDDAYFFRSTHAALLPSPTPGAFDELIDLFDALLKARSAQSFEFTIDDPQPSLEVSDTLWSSVEVMMFAPWGEVGPGEDADDIFPPDPELSISGWPLVARVHQRALCRNWYSNHDISDRDVPHTPATQTQQQLMTHVQQLTGVGSPEAFGLGKTVLTTVLNNTFSRGYWTITTRMQPETGPRILPIYLRTPG